MENQKAQSGGDDDKYAAACAGRDRYKAALEEIAAIGPNNFAMSGAQVLADAVRTAKRALKGQC